MLANTIVKAALRSLLVIEIGQEPTTAQYVHGLEAVNDLIKIWSIQHNLIYENTREILTIPSGTQQITIGPTGTLVTGAPVDIIAASLKSGNTEYELKILSTNEYNSYSDKTISTLPHGLYYRSVVPNGIIYFNSTTDIIYQLILTSMKRLAQFVDGTTDNPLPEEYETALKANLKIYIADDVGAGNKVSPQMIMMANHTLDAIIGNSINLSPSTTDIGSIGIYNIESDQ